MKIIIWIALTAATINLNTLSYGATFSFEDHFTDSNLSNWGTITSNVDDWTATVSGSSLTLSSITETPETQEGQYARVKYTHYIGYDVTDFHLRWDLSWTQTNNTYVQDATITLGKLKISFGIGDAYTTSQPYFLYMINDTWYAPSYVQYSGSGHVDINYDINQYLTITWNDSTILYSGSYIPESTELDNINMTFQKQIVPGGQFGSFSTDYVLLEGNGTSLISEPVVPEPNSILLIIFSCVTLFIRKRHIA